MINVCSPVYRAFTPTSPQSFIKQNLLQPRRPSRLRLGSEPPTSVRSEANSSPVIVRAEGYTDTVDIEIIQQKINVPWSPGCQPEQKLLENSRGTSIAGTSIA